jgi:lysophospholipase L1-like esterase
MRILTKRTPLLAIGAALALSACVGDGDELINTPPPAVGGELFARYVSLGNSITAGFQSGGIRDSVQARSYPVFLAAKAGAVFNPPYLRTVTVPGGANNTPCPRLMVAPLTFPPATAGTCVRVTAPRFVSNLAVPGEKIGDLLHFDPTASNAGLHALIVGGPQTQLEAMAALDPTLVSVWIGNNDALSAALGGQPALMTPASLFAARVDSVAAVIAAEAPIDAILIGVVNPVLAAPLLQPGAYFYLARDVGTGTFNGKPVNANCSPVNSLGQPNPLAANMISFAIFNTPIPEINCDPAANVAGGAYLLDTNEQGIVNARITAYNAAIQAAAAAHGWIYVNPNQVIAPLLAQTNADGLYQNVRKCQLLATATNALSFQNAILKSCPVPFPDYAAPNFFGALFSFDGVHPSTAAHVIFANVLAAAINAKHGTTLPT